MSLLCEKQKAELSSRSTPRLDDETLRAARDIVESVRSKREGAALSFALQFGELAAGQAAIVSRAALQSAFESLQRSEQELLTRSAERISAFAGAQRAALRDFKIPVPGGFAGQRMVPVGTAACYAPGGRYPYPSSVLMTACTARAAGVARVLVASPRPSKVTLAAAHVAKTDSFLQIGGAQGIAALRFGLFGLPPADLIVGPGNRFVAAAKEILRSEVGIDMLAGPSELLIVADSSTSAEWIAADLLAQAEHDTDAVPMLLTTDRSQVLKVNQALERQLESLSTAATARDALRNGFAVVVTDIKEAAEISNSLAPEHLQLMFDGAEAQQQLFTEFGAAFIGAKSAEVFGDYGAGPNHVLPTAGTAKFSSGLSVYSFLQSRTFLEISDPTELARDAEQLAELEGLHAHAAAARQRCHNED